MDPPKRLVPAFNRTILELKLKLSNFIHSSASHLQPYHIGIETTFQDVASDQRYDLQPYHIGIETVPALGVREFFLVLQPYHIGIETTEHIGSRLQYRPLQPYHIGIETDYRAEAVKKARPFNRTILELKLLFTWLVL